MSLTYFKDIIRLAIPVIAAQLGQMLFGIMDTAMVGKLGTLPLSSSAFVNYIFNVPQVFLLGFSSAVSVLISTQFGAKNYKKCGAIFIIALTYISVLTVLIIAGTFLLKPHLDIFNQPSEVIQQGQTYYDLIMWSAFPIVLFFVAKHFTDSTAHPYIAVISIAIGLATNYVLNLALIFGNWGFPSLGLTGAGIATLIARTLTSLILILYIFVKSDYKKFFSKQILFFDKFEIKKISALGFPSAIQYTFEVMAFAGSGIMMGWLGVQEIAAHQIVLQLASLTFMVALGLSFATSIRIGQLRGQNDFVGARQTGFLSFWLIIGINTIFGVLLAVYKIELAKFFVNDAKVWELTSVLFIIAALFQIFDGTQAVWVSSHRALEDVKVPTVITFTAYWIIALPLGYFLAFHTGLKHAGIWVGLWGGLTFSSVFLTWRFHKLTHKLITSQESILP